MFFVRYSVVHAKPVVPAQCKLSIGHTSLKLQTCTWQQMSFPVNTSSYHSVQGLIAAEAWHSRQCKHNPQWQDFIAYKIRPQVYVLLCLQGWLKFLARSPFVWARVYISMFLLTFRSVAWRVHCTAECFIKVLKIHRKNRNKIVIFSNM